MIGNDIVDLEDPDTRPETFRPRFDERVFDAAERRSIARDADPHKRRWAHWAAKEAGYKLGRQADEDFVFTPSRLVARFEAIESEDKRPELFLIGSVKIDLEEANDVLKEAGFSNLSKLKKLIELEEMPLLGTGKTDYQTIKQIVREQSGE